jgi:hypothetical protein
MEVSMGRRSLQERFERTSVGHILISVFLLMTMVTLVTANLPPSRLQDLLLSAEHPYLYGIALDQDWGVFAPDPRHETIDVTARVTFADGSQADWKVPRRNPVIGEYIDYRWLKWTEYVILPSQSQLWRPAALYVARRLASPAHRPTQVTLTNHWYDVMPPGQISDKPFLHRQTFYRTTITEAMLRGKNS